MRFSIRPAIVLCITAATLPAILMPAAAYAVTQQSGSVGIQATLPGPAPNQAPTIDIPSNGQSFVNLPIKVSGLCQSGLLVEVYKNNVFTGSVVCAGGSYSLQIDLFSGRNDLVARQYDALDQASPDSNTVSVTYNTSFAGNAPQVLITTQYAKRGADPGSVLTWPLSISGGNAPYAVSIDWGDKTAFELLSLAKPGDFNAVHTYNAAGTYNITVKATDANGNTAFLQLVGVGNGPITQTTKAANQNVIIEKEIIWWPFILLVLLAITGFWLGRKHQLDTIRSRLRRGQRPF
ncbi:MAG TPA: PKD domain-containing protein [Candidatus Nitrosopolaris sp.]|nr:PKD domain-containing protein [Candidatus Nitrosopolaris sp.]